MIAAGLLIFDYFQIKERFPAQTFIGEVNVSGLDQAEAYEKLSRLKVGEVFSPLVTFEAENRRFSFSPEAVGIKINYEATIRNAFEITHKEGYLKELKARLEREAIRCPLILEADEKQLMEVVEALSEELRSTVRDATIIFYEETGGYHIEAEAPGRSLDAAKTTETFKARLAQAEKIFPVFIDYEYPRITEKVLREAPPVYRLSAYTTYYGTHDSPNRIHNIKLMASWLDGTLLMAEDEFSLVDAVGEFTPERGFKEAFVIYGGVLTPMLGGGGCQIGTTLYNAAALADLEIISRRNHSFYFNIYPLGRDATIYPGQIDLKFKNNTGQPLLIKSIATNKRLSFRLYGTPAGKKVEFSAPEVFLLGADNKYHPSSVKEVLEADRPFKTTVIRTVYDSAGAKIKEETLRSSYKLYGEKSNVPIARPEPR